jgi:hypothetical protein
MVVADAVLYMRNASLDRQRERAAHQGSDRLPMRSL